MKAVLPRSLFPDDPPRVAERLLIEFAPRLTGTRILTTTLGRGQFARTWIDLHPHTSVRCWFLDLYAQQRAAQHWGTGRGDLDFCCAADPPAGPFDLVVLPLPRQGEAELVRDQLQLGHERLEIGGTFVVAVENREDNWVHDQLKELFDKVSRHPQPDGVVYSAVKHQPLKKLKNYACEFAFRDGERLIHLRSRPSVFSHRSLDTGARALIESMPLTAGQRVLDIGCGSGAVALSAACRLPDGHVHAIDSNPRAVEAVAWAAQRNEVTNVTATLDCDGSTLAPHSFDLALGNPPYYSNFRLAEIFIQIACRTLKPSGKLLLVTKMPEWYERNLSRWFGQFELSTARQFQVFACSDPKPPETQAGA